MEASLAEKTGETIHQMEPVEATQIPNSAGGYTWRVSDMGRLRRFLCLGSEGGTYYIKERELGLQNAACINRLIKEGKGEELLKEIVQCSVSGRAAKQNSTLFALAMCARQDTDRKVKRLAYSQLDEVCRIPTHLFQFIEYAEKLSTGTGWGRAHRDAISAWYNKHANNPKKLALMVTKYRHRNGWSHKDVFRLSHLKPQSDGVGAVIRYVVKGMDLAKTYYLKDDSDDNTKKTFEFLEAFEAAQAAENVDTVVKLIKDQNLAREHVPTKFLNDTEVWRTLLPHMPMTAMMRNLGKMSAIGLFLKKNSPEEQHVVDQLTNESKLKEARIHPFNVLLALKTYEAGKGDKGKLTWPVNRNIKDALERAFYLSFKFVEPTGKRYCLALDVSGSMTFSAVNNTGVLNCRDASAALAMVTARTEQDHEFMAFTHRLVPLNITAAMSLDAVVKEVSDLPFGATDCALPMEWARTNNKKFDVFVIYTDCETFFGDIHPAAALREYRKHSGIWDARLIVCAMCSNEFSIADPEDPGMLDMAGFDSAGPQVMYDFITGRL